MDFAQLIQSFMKDAQGSPVLFDDNMVAIDLRKVGAPCSTALEVMSYKKLHVLCGERPKGPKGASLVKKLSLKMLSNSI